MQHSTGYIIGFAVAVCLVCALFVSSAAVGLKERQEQNRLLDRQKKVLTVAGLIEEGQELSSTEVSSLFDANIQQKVIDLRTGEVVSDVDVASFDQQEAASDPARSFEAPENDSRIRRLPNHALVFDVVRDGKLAALIIPVEGYGLWGTLYGYLALEPDARTIVGITFYKHEETPGLGGEVDNPRWKALWPGRLAYDDRGNPAIGVKKGPAGPPSEDPYRVDGLSGATLTSRGVTALLRFWLGDDGFGPYLEKFRASARA
ncbi:MAG: Na(+)-translocating NADH-quinone reductase subunit C [Spirochaetaceae bacterium]|nr:Na(+)-translocating NADH-quinone reductase subunit C [Myxococcales bacterium]MCB9724936.1 Na(+)-translocating NADH-quinone reductase subunit C [Spirochaetaceae bacterium]HPG25556.1 Na(+)-translocating NADH-quinone reductase subunit C [Myxococcota bacterium]